MATERYALWIKQTAEGHWCLAIELDDLAEASHARTPLLNEQIPHYVWDRHARIQLAHWGRE